MRTKVDDPFSYNNDWFKGVNATVSTMDMQEMSSQIYFLRLESDSQPNKTYIKIYYMIMLQSLMLIYIGGHFEWQPYWWCHQTILLANTFSRYTSVHNGYLSMIWILNPTGNHNLVLRCCLLFRQPLAAILNIFDTSKSKSVFVFEISTKMLSLGHV